MERRCTIADVARAAGVSKQTVSRVLNNKGELSAATRERILAVIKELGFQPNAAARSLLTGRSYTIGLVVPDIGNPFFVDIAGGVRDAAREQGYHVLLYDTGDSPEVEAQSIQLLHERRADGLIICSSRLSDERLASLLMGVGPVVLVNRWVKAVDVPQIGADYVKGAWLATNHLLELGHRRIAAITLKVETPNSRAKFEGYRKAMEEAGLGVDPDLIAYSRSSLQGGVEAGNDLLGRPQRPTAIVAYSDPVGIGAMHACRHWGMSVPENMAVIGFGGNEISTVVNPPLSTVFIRNFEMGRRAVELLLERVADSRSPQVVEETEAHLIIRASTTMGADPLDDHRVHAALSASRAGSGQ
ncbi:MAG: LacI family transcriptional regulator [Bacteroidetes bacterium]|nr:LacI family transcriptional regulator [Bacteroidota bacterium]